MTALTTDNGDCYTQGVLLLAAFSSDLFIEKTRNDRSDNGRNEGCFWREVTPTDFKIRGAFGSLKANEYEMKRQLLTTSERCSFEVS